MTKPYDWLDWKPSSAKCPICGIGFNDKGKPQCEHMKAHKEHIHVQAQKYHINPLWRRRRGGKTGQMK